MKFLKCLPLLLLVCCSGKEMREDVEKVLTLAEQGDAKAQRDLGLHYAKGDGVKQDYAHAAKWYRKAAEQGDAWAQHSLGWCYLNGKGVTQDNVTAYKWINLASENGEELAELLKQTLSRRMTKQQIAEAQKMSREWMEKREKAE